MSKKVVIIGAGLGGLECGYILAKNGYDITVLEHDKIVGGCLQSFRRGKALFDTGFHYVGGLREGESLHGLFRYFNLLSLPWQQLDEDCFDEVVIGNKSYPFANGHQRFVERLVEYFPHEKEGLKRFVKQLKEVGEHLPDSFLPRQTEEFYANSLFARSAYNWLNDTIHDPTLRKILSGTSLKMELNAERLPLYVFAQINNSFIQSAWRIKGGGGQIAEHLAESIRQMGGTIRVNATVTSIVERGGKAIGVRINREEFMPADYIIAAQHPQALMSLLADSQVIRNIYRRRISNLKNSFGMFTANIRLKPNCIKYENKNIFVHTPDADLWNVNSEKAKSVMVSYYAPSSEDNADFSPAIDLLTPLRWYQVAQWAAEPQGRRGESYVDFKNKKTEECLNLVEKRIPELRGSIDAIFTSTPLSYHHYTLTQNGSAYGIQKDWQSPITTVLSPRTPIPNLLLTGQNLNLHGVLGTSMTSVFTCAEILGMDNLSEQLDVKHWK